MVDKRKTERVIKKFSQKLTNITQIGKEPLVLPNHSRGKSPDSNRGLANKKYVDERTHDAVTTTDSSTINFTLTGQNITAATIDSGIVHDNLSGFVANEHIDWTTANAGTIHTSNFEALQNIVEDTTPELGGELNCGAHTIGFTQQTTTGDGTTTIDWRLGNKFKFTFGAQNETFTFTAPTNPCNILLMLVQDGTGSRTATWPASVKWPGGTAPTLTTTANAIDIIAFYYDGTNYYGESSLNFS